MNTITVYAECQARVKERWALEVSDDIAAEWVTADEERRREIVDGIVDEIDGPEATGKVLSVENVEVDNEEDRVWDVVDVKVSS